VYTEKVNNGIIPIFRGHLLTDTDLIIRKHILNLMCNLETEWSIGLNENVKAEIIARLQEIIEDGLVTVSETKISVKEEGRMFVRNICMAFDLRLIENQPDTRVFSMTI
jgi:oxygen-independent coproporphyrinogen-3 oxidase